MRVKKIILTLLASSLLASCSSHKSIKNETTLAKACSGKVSLRMVDYFLPMLLGKQSAEVWGAETVLPRDIANGLESAKAQPEWNYWDGKIIKGPQGKYHLFASRWSGELTHYDWSTSVAVHAVSDSPKGPYQNPQPFFSDRDGVGHNITGGILPDGRYYVVASDAGRSGDVFASDTIDGEFELQGTVTMEANSQNLEQADANVSIIVRPTASFCWYRAPAL